MDEQNLETKVTNIQSASVPYSTDAPKNNNKKLVALFLVLLIAAAGVLWYSQSVKKPIVQNNATLNASFDESPALFIKDLLAGDPGYKIVESFNTTDNNQVIGTRKYSSAISATENFKRYKFVITDSQKWILLTDSRIADDEIHDINAVAPDGVRKILLKVNIISNEAGKSTGSLVTLTFTLKNNNSKNEIK